MQKTTNYQLNKPETGDPLRVADFNENADKIDAALSGLNTAVGNKADTSALAALQSAVNGKGNCRITWGTYVGNGKVGSANPNTLNFGFYPIMVWVSGTSTSGSWFRTSGTTRYTTPGGYEFVMTWSDTGVSWYHDSDYSDSQLNTKNEVYYYYAIGA